MPRVCRSIALLILIIIAGCDRAAAAGAGEKKVVELRFWNGFTGPDGRTMLAIVKRFNQANPDVRVTMQRMEWATYYNKLFVAGLGGRAPEVFVIHTDTLARFTRANFVRAVDDFTGPGGVDTGDIDANVWQAVEHGGKHWAIPLDIHLLGMYYNRALFKKAGIAKPPTNRAEFVDALRRLKGIDGEGTWGFVFASALGRRTNVYSMCRQNGGDIFNADYTAPVLVSRENVEVLDFASELIKSGLVPPVEDIDAWVGFRQGKVGMVFEGIYMLADARKQKDLDFGAAPLPVLFKQPAAWANSHNLCVRADLSGAQLDAARRFIAFLSDNSLEWAAAGQVPVRKSLRQSDRFAEMTAQRQFASQISDAQYMPTVPFVFEYQEQFDRAIEYVLRGQMSPADALQAAASRIQKISERYAKSEVAQ